MNAQSLVCQLSDFFAVSEYEIVAMGLLAPIDQEVWQARDELDTFRKRHYVATEQALYEAIQERGVAAHPV